MVDREQMIRAKLIDPLPPDETILVGFSVNQCSLRASLVVARWVKASRPKAFVVFGGQLYSDPEKIGETLDAVPIDAVIVGDGEETLVELAEIIEAGRPPESCAGMHLKRDGAVVETRPRPPLLMDSLPFSDFSVLDLESYNVPENLYHDSFMIMASRGCVRHCTFCGSRFPWKGYRSMSGRRVYDEIVHQTARYSHFKVLKFYDILINGNMKHLSELCDLLIADPSEKLFWREANCIVRPEMTPEILKKMYAAGCRHVTFGIESGSDRVLGLMEKGQTAALAERVLRDTHESGIELTANFMFGYPGETEEDFDETLEFVRRIHPYVDIFYPSRTFITMEPNSTMAKNKKELGIDDGTDIFWGTTDGTNTYPVRLARYERFSQVLYEVGAWESPGVNSSVELDRCNSLGRYYAYKNEHQQAVQYFEKYLTLDPECADVRGRLEACQNALAPTR